VNLFFDESGDFAFSDGPFDAYAQAALICPTASLDHLDRFVSERSNELGLDELHAHKLSSRQLLEVCRFLGRSDCQLLASVTDTALITRGDIERHRLDQAAATQRNLDSYRARGGSVAEIVQWMSRQVKRAGLPSQIPHGDFVQAQFMLGLIADALQKALLWYQEDRWAPDLATFYFVLDGKLPAKMASSEKYLSESIVPTLGTRRVPLEIPERWKKGEVPHPFIATFERERGRIRGEEFENVIDLKAIFGNGLRFEDSKEYPGLQLADVTAHVVRRALLESENTAIQQAYDHLRPKLVMKNGRCLLINRFRGSSEAGPLDRYQPLHSTRRVGR
jgi:hypothetical protein